MGGDNDIARTELENAIAAEVGTDPDFREGDGVQSGGGIIHKDVTVATRGLTDCKGSDIAASNQLERALEVKGARRVVSFTERHGVTTQGGVSRGDVDDRCTTDADANTVLASRRTTTEVLDGATIADGQSRETTRGFGEVEVTRVASANHLETRGVRDLDRGAGGSQALARVEARAEV